jgi:hypothetical protein
MAATAAGRPDLEKHPGLVAHLDGCPHCREELLELERVAATLRLVDPDRLSNPPHPPATLANDVATAIASVRREHVQPSRWRSVVVGALAAAAAFLVMIGIVAVATRSDGGPGAQHVAFAQAPPGVEASADLTSTQWGTQVSLDVDGLAHDGDVYWLWLSTADGDRIAAGTFSGDGTVQLAAALPLDKAARIWVTDGKDAVVLDAQLH